MKDGKSEVGSYVRVLVVISREACMDIPKVVWESRGPGFESQLLLQVSL